MAKPSPQDMRADKPLTDFSLAVYNEDANFAHIQAPGIGVDDRSFTHYKMSIADNMRNSAEVRTSGTEAAEDGYDLTSVAQSLKMVSLKKGTDIDDMADEDEVLDSEESAVAFLAHKHKLAWEVEMATALFGASIWGGTDQTGVASGPSSNQFVQWNSSAAVPAANVLAWQELIEEQAGMEGNTLIVGSAVHRAVCANPDVIDRIKHTGEGGNTNKITRQKLAEYFGVENYWVSKVAINTANEGLTASMSKVIGKAAVLCYVNPRPAPRTPTAFLKRYWKRMPGGSDGMRVDRYFVPEKKSQVVELSSCMGFHVVCSELGKYASAVVA